MTSDLSVTPVAQLLLDCFETEISRVDRPPLTVGWRTGNQVELLLSTRDNECCSGVGWLRVSSIFPSGTFPEPDSEHINCGPLAWAAVLELGVARCAPTPGADTIPSVEEWTAVALAVQDDAAAMRRAVCCFAELDEDRMHVVGPWLPLTTEGGCVGGVMTITVSIGDCDCG